MGEWKEYKLSALCTKIGSGATPTGGDNSYKSDGVSLIRSQNVLDLDFSASGLAFIDEDQAYDLRNVTVEPNDVLLNITGDSVARTCKVPRKVLPARVNQHVSIIRSRPEELNPDFLLYYLHSSKEHLLSLSEVGATRRALTKGIIENLIVNIPGIIEQRAIAAILSSLDDKIDLLHRQNQTLEALAETLFRQWFVEEADEGWEMGKLGDVLELAYGKGLKEEIRSGTGYPVMGSSGVVGYHSEFLVIGPGIVIGRKGTLGKVNYVFENFFPIDTTYFIRSKVESRGLYYEYFLLKSLDLAHMNTDSAVPGLNRENALSLEISIPSKQQVFKFNVSCEPLFLKLRENVEQIRTLMQLRDTLLPKLMSGEIRLNQDLQD